MSNTGPEPLPVEVLGTSRESNYLIKSKLERGRILRDLQKDRELISAYAGGTRFLTAILAVDTEAELLYLDCAQDPEVHKQVLTGGPLLCATRLKKVTIEFAVTKAASATHSGHPAYKVAVPERMVRVQRREFYRAILPVFTKAQCDAVIGDTTIALRVADISVGGVGLETDSELQLVPGTHIDDARLQLPDIGLIIVALEVRSSYTRELQNGARLTHIGCRFIKLPDKHTTLIQRYIYNLEREQKAKSGEG